MKKKFLIVLLISICVFSCAFGFTACSKSSSSTEANKFISVTDGVFKSAGYSNSSSDKSAKTSATSVQKLAVDVNTMGGKFDTLYRELRGEDNASVLNDYNLNYVKGSALYQGVNLASVFKAMASVLGDKVFSNVYDLTKMGMPSSVAKLTNGDYYTLCGFSTLDSGSTSAIQIDFKEYGEGKFIFKIAQYSKVNGVSELRFSYYDSQSVAFIATLQGNINVDLSNYESNYNDFSVVECTLAIFGKEDYISGVVNTNVQDEVILKFVKTNLEFDNNTYKNLTGISNGKSIGDKELGQIVSKISADRYVNPYMGSDGSVSVIVSNEYRIPDDVTEVAKASIPATKKLIVPSHVVKILDAPFKYPQFVEEIVFEDPDNGSLIQIGDDDIVDVFEGDGDNGHYSYENRFNLSYYFLISYTKVKNFTLPKTVKKIEGPIYITTDMQTLDLSQYHPDYTLPEDKFEQAGYSVSLYTSVYNRTDGLYKELGSVEKLYVNGDYSLKFYGRNDIGYINPESGKMDIDEYKTANRSEDKYYSYSPTEEIYKVLFGLANSGQGLGDAKDYGEYRGYTKVSNLVDEVILTGFNENFDLKSELFRSVSITVDIEDFPKVYNAINKAQTDKEYKFILLENGSQRTKISFIGEDGQDGAVETSSSIKTPNGNISFSQLGYKQEFYAPAPMETTKIKDGQKYYFVGWSFDKDSDSIDVFEGDKVVNYFQKMYAIYQTATSGLEYTLKDDGTYKVTVANVNQDVIIISDTYEGKSVSTLELGSYTCKKMIIPYSINTANSGVLCAIAENQLNGFNGIYKFTDVEEIRYWLQNERLVEKLKTCNAVNVENGLYYLKGNVSNYFMLFYADESLKGKVSVSSQCHVVAVEFNSGVTSLSLYSVKYLSYLKFEEINSLSIPDTTVYVGKVEGKVKDNFLFPIVYNGKLNLESEAFCDLDAASLFIQAEALTQETLAHIGDVFNSNTKVYMSYEYKDIENFEFENISDNIYFFIGSTQPDFSDDGVNRYNYWYYGDNMKIATRVKE